MGEEELNGKSSRKRYRKHLIGISRRNSGPRYLRFTRPATFCGQLHPWQQILWRTVSRIFIYKLIISLLLQFSKSSVLHFKSLNGPLIHADLNSIHLQVNYLSACINHVNHSTYL